MDSEFPGWLNYLLWAGFGGLVTFIIQSWWTSLEAKRAREAEGLKDQLSGLYGPLYMLASQNSLLLQHASRVDAEYMKAFGGGNDLSEQALQARSDRMRQTLDVMNDYWAIMLEINKEIVGLIRQNWHLVDPEDTKLLLDFLGHILRRRVEVGTDGKHKLPLPVLLNMPPINLWNPELEVQVRERFIVKQKRLRELSA